MDATATSTAEPLGLLLSLVVAVICGYIAWRSMKNDEIHIDAAPTDHNRQIIESCPSFRKFFPTPWLPSSHLTTVFASLYRSCPGILYTRELLDAVDGGVFSLDWHTKPQRGQPVIIIQHGMTGGSNERYVQWMIKRAHERLNACCVVMNARGCNDTELRTPRIFSGSCTADFTTTVKHVRQLVGPQTPLIAVGYSLGAGLLTKYVAEQGSDCDLLCAVACCASFDMQLTARTLEQWFKRMTYNKRLTNSMKDFMRRHQAQFTDVDWLDLQRLFASSTLREFDSASLRLFGYGSVDEYYDDCSTADALKDVRVPMLVLSARDDPICSTEGLPLSAIQANDRLIAVRTGEGGHVAWCQGWWPTQLSWENDAVCDYAAAILAQHGY